MKIPSSFLLLASLLFVFNGHGKTNILVEGKSNVHIVYLGDINHDDADKVTESHHNLLAAVVGSKQNALESIVYSYRHGFSGFAAKLTESQAQKVAELPGVVKVIPNSLHKLQTTRSWDSLGLSLSSQSNSNLLRRTASGDNVIIGIFDTGITPESKSFSDDGLGPIPSSWKGKCQSGDQFNATKHCNRKIIGARYFVDGFKAENNNQLPTTNLGSEYISPRDANGHGTHTASTAAGTLVGNISYRGLAGGTVRGGAPKARLAIYKVCWTLCASADILMAFDTAIHDGVDVISVSLGSSVPLYSSVDDRNGIAVGAFHAVASGITVVCAGGNSGPFDQTVVNVSPWILTVASNGIDRAFPSAITLGNNQTFMGQAMYTGKEIGFTGLYYPEPAELDFFSPGDCDFLQLNKSSTVGKVVLCFYTSAQTPSIANAAFAVSDLGGVGLIAAKHESGGALSPCPGDFPCISVDFEVGTKILFYTRSTRDPLVKLSPSITVMGRPISQKVSYFSSRGPNSISPAVLKPDISAPGENILAATALQDGFGDNGYAIFSGTSMATPHVSGIVALLKSLHPTWSPAAIRSALVTTASRASPSGGPIFAEGSSRKVADPFDFGGGIVNPNAAANPGLIYDLGKSDYIDYLCAMHYNNSAISRLAQNVTSCSSQTPSVLDLNLPSITIPSLRKTRITVTRTVTNVGPRNSKYRVIIEAPVGISVSVKPDVLVFNSRVTKRSFKVTFSTRYEVDIGYVFGSLTWSSRGYAVIIPLSVKTDLFQPFGNS